MKKAFTILLTIAFSLSLISCDSSLSKIQNGYYENSVLSQFAKGDYSITAKGMGSNYISPPTENFGNGDAYSSHYLLCVNDTNSELLFAKNATEKMYPASITKCMTCLLVLENATDLNEKVKVKDDLNEGIYGNATMAGLQVGDEFTVDDLLYAMCIPSGNDAANVLAGHIAGSVSAFVDRMNEKAKSLGMLNTHFVNVHGIHDDRHYTSPYDLYILLHECCKHEEFFNYTGTIEKTIRGKNGAGEEIYRTYKSTNSALLGYTPLPAEMQLLGTKTGYTSLAGRCVVIITEDLRRQKYISVLGKADNHDHLYADFKNLMNEESVQKSYTLPADE